MKSGCPQRHLLAALIVALAVFLLPAVVSPFRTLASTASRSQTEVVGWSPFDALGGVRKGLTVNRIRREGQCDAYSIAYTYRCGVAGRDYGACWRDEYSAQPDFVICAENPWVEVVTELRVPNLLLDVGATFKEPREPPPRESDPWGVELSDGNRCVLQFGGSRGFNINTGEGLTLDYRCENDVGLVSNLRRSSPWRIGAARDLNNTIELTGDVFIKKAIFSDPAALDFRYGAASSAAAFALGIYEQVNGATSPNEYVSRVRLSSDTEWARVTIEGRHATNILLRRGGDGWVATSSYRSLDDLPRLGQTRCRILPRRLMRQLFDVVESSSASAVTCDSPVQVAFEKNSRPWFPALPIALTAILASVAAIQLVRRRPRPE